MKLLVLLVLIVLFVLLAAGSGLFLRQDPGYVFFGYGEWSVETNLAVFAIGELLLLGVVYFLLRALGGLWRLPRRVAQAARKRSRLRAERGLAQGLTELAEGNWERAERLLLRDAGNSERPLLHYLAAARAAQFQGADQRRDAYLKRAIESNPQADLAVGLTQAELQLAHRQSEAALATLSRLRKLAPKHDYVLHMLAGLHRQLGDWQQLNALLPELRRRQLFDAPELEAMELETWQGLLQPGQTGDVARLQQQWEALPRPAREHERLLSAYSQRLLELGGDALAEPLLRNHLNRNWSSPLARSYGLVQALDAARQLDHAEGWLKAHGRDAMLLLTLGRLCKRRGLWGKARIYLESSLGLAERAETHLELGELLQTLGETDGACEQFRRGLALSVGDTLPRRAGGVVALARPPAVPAPAAPVTEEKEASAS